METLRCFISDSKFFLKLLCICKTIFWEKKTKCIFYIARRYHNSRFARLLKRQEKRQVANEKNAIWRFDTDRPNHYFTTSDWCFALAEGCDHYFQDYRTTHVQIGFLSVVFQRMLWNEQKFKMLLSYIFILFQTQAFLFQWMRPDAVKLEFIIILCFSLKSLDGLNAPCN